jgi:hypothetical protein
MIPLRHRIIGLMVLVALLIIAVVYEIDKIIDPHLRLWSIPAAPTITSLSTIPASPNIQLQPPTEPSGIFVLQLPEISDALTEERVLTALNKMKATYFHNGTFFIGPSFDETQLKSIQQSLKQQLNLNATLTDFKFFET